MGLAEEIRQRIETVISPETLEIVDESEMHRGHSGFREGGESHFRVHLRASGLAPLGRVARERAVHKALGPEIIGRIHALALKIEV
jgi:BolA protein